MMDERRGKKRGQLQVSMDVLPAADGKQLPLVTYFPTPFDPCAEHQDSESGAEAALYRNTEKFRTAQVQLVVRTDGNVDYVGGNAIGESVPWQPTMFAMGVFDKEQGTLKVVPVVGNKVLRMEPIVRGVAYKLDEGHGDDVELDSHARHEKTKDLVERFGTKKAKSMLQKMSRTRVKETALAGSASDYKNLVEEATKQDGLLMSRQSVIEAANQALVRRIPAYDLQATTPDDAYPLDKIIPPEEWEALEVDELLSASKKALVLEALRSENKYPKFVLDRLHRIKVTNDNEGNAKRARMLVYLRHLFTMFHATKGRVFPGRDPDFDESAVASIPGVVYQKLRSLFVVEKPADPSRKSNISLLRDYLLSYILVLGLKVDGHEVDPFDIAAELKMTVTSLEPHYQQLGCKIEGSWFKGSGRSTSGERSKSKISLRVPLTLLNLEEKRKGPPRRR